MRISKTYSHFHGLAYLRVRRPQVWSYIRLSLVQSDMFTSLGDCGLMKMVKDRVAINVQTGRSNRQLYEGFSDVLGLYVSDQIDIGLEIFPMTALVNRESLKIDGFECALAKLAKFGRTVPAVPLVLVGIDT